MSFARRFFRAVLYGVCCLAAASQAADVPRIVRLTSVPSRSASAPIREPAPAPSIAEPPNAELPLESRRRSEYVPIALPQPAPPIDYSPAPQMPAEPQFTPADAPRDAATGSGPLLASPTAPPSTITAAPQFPLATKPAEPSQPPPAAPPVEMPQPPLVASSPVNSAALQAVVQRSMQKADQAAAMAERGMLYSARSELVQALQLIAQALDAQQASTTHASALATGLTAMEEARDFAAQPNGPSEDFEVRAVAASHRTQALAIDNASPASPVAAQQKYLALAQGCMIKAAGHVPAASQILYRLGRLETAMALHDADPLALHGPQAMVFHQAALATDAGNWLAANELGVLYAHYGQLDAARQLLVASVTTHPHVAGWQNLAAIHRRLGENDLAQRAQRESELLASKPGAAATGISAKLRWVDAKTFAAAGGSDVKWPAEVANKSTNR